MSGRQQPSTVGEHSGGEILIHREVTSGFYSEVVLHGSTICVLISWKKMRNRKIVITLCHMDLDPLSWSEFKAHFLQGQDNLHCRLRKSQLIKTLENLLKPQLKLLESVFGDIGPHSGVHFYSYFYLNKDELKVNSSPCH